MAKPLFRKIKTHPSEEKKTAINKNRANFNLRNALENIAQKQRENREEEEGGTFEAQIDMGDDAFNLKGGCEGGACSAYDGTGGASGDEEGDDKVFAQKFADAIMGLKGRKYNRIQNRKDRLNKDWRQGIGTQGTGVIMYNPINRLRKKRANTQLYRLKKRHPGSAGAK
jgi:hypothetical protein